MELSELDIRITTAKAMKGQALADFVAKLTSGVETEEGTWEVYVDGSTERGGSSIGILIRSPTGMRIEHVVNFGYVATNN